MIIKIDRQPVAVTFTQRKPPKAYILNVVEITTGPEGTVITDSFGDQFVYPNTAIVDLEVILPNMTA